MVNWRKNDISSIKCGLKSKIHSTKDVIENVSNHRGLDKESVKRKIKEIKESERLEKMCNFARMKRKRFKSKAKRKIKGGM
jgi:hypothetical protein